MYIKEEFKLNLISIYSSLFLLYLRLKRGDLIFFDQSLF